MAQASQCRADTMGDDFAWFSSLGYPDVHGLKPVRFIATWFSSGTATGWQPSWEDGFLLTDGTGSFQVLDLGFNTLNIPKNPNPRAEMDYRFEPEDLATAAKAKSKMILEDKYSWAVFFDSPGMRDSAGYSPRAALFILAWACERQGLPETARQLYDAAQTAGGTEARNAPTDPGEENGWTFHEKLDHDLGEFAMWRLILDFGDPAVTRPQLLERTTALLKNFPHCDYIEQAKQIANELKKMVAEDKAHPDLSDEQIAGLAPEQQVAEWIFRLRDQNGHQWSQPGTVDLFDQMRGAQNTPAHHLVALGDAAVPQLIDALGDKRFTRSVGYFRDFVFSHEVLTVGDAAHKILERISGQRLMGSYDNPADTHEAVEEWWTTHQGLGEKEALTQVLEQGGEKSPDLAKKLVEKYPEDAAGPLMKGASAAYSWRIASSLIHTVACLKDNRIHTFLLGQAKDGRTVGGRAQAAYELAKKGDVSAIAALATLWQTSQPGTNEPEDESGPGEGKEREKLVEILALADSPVGINALSTGLIQRSPKTREVVLGLIAEQDWGHYAADFDDEEKSVPGNAVRSVATRQAIEELLGRELDDTGVYMNDVYPTFAISLNGYYRVPDLSFAEYAAALLARDWPTRYQFDPNAVTSARLRQRIICLNTWNASHGLAPQPVPPEARPVKAGDEGKVARVVRQGGKVEMPDAVEKVVSSAVGRECNTALFQDILDAYRAANRAGTKLTSGIEVRALSGEDHDGVTLVVTPSRVDDLGGLQPDPIGWHITYRLNPPYRGSDMAYDGNGLAGEFALPASIPSTGVMEFRMMVGPQSMGDGGVL
jgi:hypothetical protein